MTVIPGDHMTDGQRELEASVNAAITRVALRVMAAIGLLAVSVIIWAVRLEGKTEQNSARIEEVRREGSQPVQDLKRDIAVLQEAMRSLTAELQRTQSTIRGTR